MSAGMRDPLPVPKQFLNSLAYRANPLAAGHEEMVLPGRY